MSVGRHTLYNLAGSIAPMFISLVTVPIYLHLIGAPKYGILAIVWMFLGYFGVFDPGLSRATAYTIARLQNANAIERQQVFWTASTINAGLGVLGGIVLYLIGQPVLGHLLKMPADLRGSVMASLPWLAAAVPVATLVGVFSGTLEGLQKFALINTVSFIGTLAFQLIPLSIAFFYTRNLTVIIAATVLVRLATAAVIFGFASFHSRSGWPRVASLSVARQLFSYGSWISVSNLIVPFLATLDKFIIGSYLGVTDVAIYTIPDNLTRRISVVPGALSRSLFPKISADAAAGSQKQVFEKSLRMLLAVMTLICVAGILGMTLFLRLWIGKDIGTPAAPIGVILLLGIFLNSLAYLPSMYLQATGRPNRNAQFHLIEIGPHVLFLFVGIYFLKLMGVALAMLFVSGFDAILLFWAADLQIWRHRHFRVASGFIVAALVSYLVFPALRWQSYIEYGLLSGACALWSLTVFRERQLTIREFFSLIGRRFRTS